MPGSGRVNCGAGAGVVVAVLALVGVVVCGEAAATVAFRVDSEALGVLDAIAAALKKKTRATRYSVVVVGWPATHRSRHTPHTAHKTYATRMAACRWQL